MRLFLLLLLQFVSLSYSMHGAKVCLTMIVKNESRIMERMLSSVKDVVDCISICDTGSTDNTIEITEAFMQKNGIPGKVHQHPWKNFGYNRTVSVELAKMTLNDLGFSLNDTYLLLLDADMVLEVAKDFKKADLVHGAYMVSQRSSEYSYYNTRLIKASLPWRCVGVTHEYWASDIPTPNVQLDTLEIDDRYDGGCKADKFERDIRLLTQGIKDEPNNERYHFYLAQSYKDIRNYDEAIKWYKARIAMGGWKEEVWYSKFMIGDIYTELGDWDQAMHWYLDAFEYNPDRAETLHRIACNYRLRGNKQLAYLFAKRGSMIPYPKDQVLFVHYPMYDYKFDEELSIVSDVTPFKEDGYNAANRLLLKRSVPKYVKDYTHVNMYYYVENLKNARYLPLKFDLPRHYSLSSSSIQRDASGFSLIARAVNYSQKAGWEYQSRDPEDDTICTKNYYVQLGNDLSLKAYHEIDCKPEPQGASRVMGHEDCRMFKMDGANWYIAANPQNHPTVGQILCRLDKTNKFVDKRIPLEGPIPGRCEKNWLPFVEGSDLLLFYSYDPLTLLKVDMATGKTVKAQEKTPPFDCSRFRGSSAPISYKDGYLLLVHEVIVKNERYYTHRFVFLDKTLMPTKVSKPFTFQHKGVEYSCGMTLDHDGKNLVLPISIEDKEAYICVVPLETVDELLETR